MLGNRKPDLEVTMLWLEVASVFCRKLHLLDGHCFGHDICRRELQMRFGVANLFRKSHIVFGRIDCLCLCVSEVANLLLEVAMLSLDVAWPV